MPANDATPVDAVDSFDPGQRLSLRAVFGNLAFPPPGQQADPFVSGRYRGTVVLSGGAPTVELALELRIDVDGRKPLGMVSGDIFDSSASTQTYLNSFSVDRVTATMLSPNQLSLSGVPKFANTGPSPLPGIPSWDFVDATVEVSWVPGAPSPTGAILALSHQQQSSSLRSSCSFDSPFFRTILYEEDRVEGVSGFASYNMADDPDLATNPFNRMLTVSDAFEEAGIKINTSVQNIVPLALRNQNPSGVADAWDDSELFAAMTANFEAQGAPPGQAWSVWLLAADRYAGQGPNEDILGVMFDDSVSAPRHGCAIFRSIIDGKAPHDPVIQKRWAMHTYMHEMGHCLNLLHPFTGSDPCPVMSWMNNPENFPNGRLAFFGRFPCQFSGRDLAHLRHGFLQNVIPGGTRFQGNAHLETFSDFDAPHFNDSDLTFELKAHRPSFLYGEPVVVELKLSRRRDDSEPQAHSLLHPRRELVHLVIQKPNGTIARYAPMMQCCAMPEVVRLSKEGPSRYDSAYIGFGKSGFYFDQVGFYRIRGVYLAPDGSCVPSTPIQIRVRRPMTDADEDVADCFFGEQQGALLYLLGSHADRLKSGNDAFDELLEKHANHPLAVYARLVKGVNAGRDFKRVTAERKLDAREADLAECIRLLSSVVEASSTGRGLDNISLNFAYRYLLAACSRRDPHAGAAKSAKNRMIDLFESKRLKPSILQSIRQQAETAYAKPGSVRF